MLYFEDMKERRWKTRMNLSEKTSNRIQVLRGLAIIAVVFIHNTPGGLAQVWCRPFINFPVGLFLFLSGLLSNAEKWSPKKRIIKVIFPYLIWTLVYVVISNYKTPSSLPVIYVKNLLTANSAAIMYYIFVYCEFTLLIPIIDKLSKSKIGWTGFLISPIEIVVMRLFPLILGYELNKYVAIILHISCLGWFTYFYLGYLIGNKRIEINASTLKLVVVWGIAIVLQFLEGYWYFSMGDQNCGTQIKLSAILTGSLFMLLSYKYITYENAPSSKFLKMLGDKSFGIYFSHLAVMSVLGKIPFYKTVVIYPFNAIITILVSLVCVIIGGRILGRFGKYLAL